ncbi:MAG: MAPEG family protein, partial [Rubellimicrobium sp.]|nr:MAPEG family protein [Rubellimicrobium sp.]
TRPPHLQRGQSALYAVRPTRQPPPGAARGPRDEPIPLRGRAARAQRAMNNHFEGLILFSIAALVIHTTGQSGAFTTACAFAYLAARIVYIPCYLYALAPWRSLVWALGWFATLLMLLAALF